MLEVPTAHHSQDRPAETVIISAHHPRGYDHAQTVEGECEGEPVVFRWTPGQGTFSARWGDRLVAYDDASPLVIDLFAPRPRPMAFWMRCEGEGLVTLGVRVVAPGDEAPRFASAAAVFNREGALLDYTGLQGEEPGTFNLGID